MVIFRIFWVSLTKNNLQNIVISYNTRETRLREILQFKLTRRRFKLSLSTSRIYYIDEIVKSRLDYTKGGLNFHVFVNFVL